MKKIFIILAVVFGLTCILIFSQKGFPMNNNDSPPKEPEREQGSEQTVELINDFYDGLAPLDVEEGKLKFIDKTGKVIELKNDPHRFREGLAPFTDGKKWGFIDKNEKVAVKPIYDEVNYFSDGLAAVRISNKWGYIDKQGKLVIKTTLEGSYPFSEGLAQLWAYVQIINKNDSSRSFWTNKWGFIDKTGKTVYEPTLDGAGPFSCGLAMIQKGNKFGYIDKQFRTVIEPQFDKAESFSDNLGLVKMGYKYFFLNKNGKRAFEEEWDFAKPFSDGAAQVWKTIKDLTSCNLIETKGSILIKDFQKRFAQLGDFHDGLANAKDLETGKWGYIDKKGNWVISPKFHNRYESSPPPGAV